MYVENHYYIYWEQRLIGRPILWEIGLYLKTLTPQANVGAGQHFQYN